MRENQLVHRGHHHGYRDRRGHREERMYAFSHAYGDRYQHRHPGSSRVLRRGRAAAFLDYLNVQRSALVQQLAQPEYEAIKPVISGELKAVDTIIKQYIQMFRLNEQEAEAAAAKETGKAETEAGGHTANDNC